jgi:hypothetical protein
MPENTLYMVDERGVLTPEVERYTEVVGLASNICHNSNELSGLIASLRQVAEGLAENRHGKFTFVAEPQAKEDLLRIAEFLKRINFKLWSVSRSIGTEAGALADRIHIEEDTRFAAELTEYMKQEPSDSRLA